MRSSLRAASFAITVLALSGTAHSQMPDVDPMSPASCDVKDGWLTVFSRAMSAWDDATRSGKLNDQKATDISVWFVAQMNRIAETNDVKGVCLDTIAKRQTEGF